MIDYEFESNPQVCPNRAGSTFYKPITSRKPSSTSASVSGDNGPTSAVRKDLVHSKNLRDIYYGALGKPGLLSVQKDIPWSIR